MVLPSVCYAELFTPLTPASTLPSVGATHLSDPRGSTPLSVSRVWTLTESTCISSAGDRDDDFAAKEKLRHARGAGFADPQPPRVRVVKYVRVQTLETESGVDPRGSLRCVAPTEGSVDAGVRGVNNSA